MKKKRADCATHQSKYSFCLKKKIWIHSSFLGCILRIKRIYLLVVFVQTGQYDKEIEKVNVFGGKKKSRSCKKKKIKPKSN